MKRFRLLIIFLFIFVVTGCTITIKGDYSEKEKEDEKVHEEEDVVSVGVVSSLDNPLVVGEFGLASKYNVYLDEYKDVDVCLKKIYNDGESIVNAYNSSNPDKSIELKEGYKFVVLDYEVIFFDFETESFGDNTRLDVEIVDSSNNSFVVDEVKQVIDVYVLEESLGVFNGGNGVVKIAFMLPEDVTNYLVKFGTYEQTIAYYKI